jgi:hypothetical protein
MVELPTNPGGSTEGVLVHRSQRKPARLPRRLGLGALALALGLAVGIPVAGGLGKAPGNPQPNGRYWSAPAGTAVELPAR